MFHLLRKKLIDTNFKTPKPSQKREGDSINANSAPAEQPANDNPPMTTRQSLRQRKTKNTSNSTS